MVKEMPEKRASVQGYGHSLTQGSLHDAWLHKTRLHSFASLPWATASLNAHAQEQLLYLLQQGALPLNSNRKVDLHPLILAEAFRLPYDGITTASELQDSDMAKVFGAKPPKEFQFKLNTMQDYTLRNRYEWFVEKVTLLVKSSYMSKKAYAVLHRAEQGEHVNWAQICYDMLNTRLNSLRKSGGRIKLSAHLHFLFQYSLARDTGPEGTITLKEEEASLKPHMVHGACDSTSSKSLIVLSEEDWKGDADSETPLSSLQPACIHNANKLNGEGPSIVREKHIEGRMGTMPNPRTSDGMHPHGKNVATPSSTTFRDTTKACLMDSFKWFEEDTENHAIDSFNRLEETTMEQAPLIDNFNWLEETTNQAPSRERFKPKKSLGKADKAAHAAAKQMMKVGQDVVSIALQEMKSPDSLAQKVQTDLNVETSIIDVAKQIDQPRYQSRMSDLKSETKMLQETLQSHEDYTPEQLQKASLIVGDWITKGATKLLDVQQKCADLSQTLQKERAEREAIEEKCEALLERVQSLLNVKKEIIQQKQQHIDEVMESKLSEMKRELKEKYEKDDQKAYKKGLLHLKCEAEKAITGLKAQLANMNVNIESQCKGRTDKNGMLVIHPQKLKQYEAHVLAHVAKIWQNQIDWLVALHASPEQA